MNTAPVHTGAIKTHVAGPHDLKALTGTIVDAAFKLHVGLGPGLLESVYQSILARDLARRGLHVETEQLISFEYDGMMFDSGLRVDMLIEKSVVVELKSVEQILPVHPKQLLTYLRLLHLPVGLLVNFGAARFKDGIWRIANGYPANS
jgi:iron complex transport system substrate-binding protein